MKSKILSSAIVILYLIIVYLQGDFDVVYALLLLVPLNFIWFSEIWAEYTGPLGHSFSASNTSPKSLVTFMGWVFLTILLLTPFFV
jgi:hypothetical protein